VQYEAGARSNEAGKRWTGMPGIYPAILDEMERFFLLDPGKREHYHPQSLARIMQTIWETKTASSTSTTGNTARI